MAKKKGKGKGKSKEKKETTEKKPKGPTKKELFEMQVASLKQELEKVEENLQQQKATLQASKNLLDSEQDSKESCIAHLQSLLARENEERLEIQERLQTERDLGELMEKRALGKFAVSDRSREVTKSMFLQQKLELEGKLSLLEELRLAKNSQAASLKRVEEALAEKISALRQKSREEDMTQVDKLLRNTQAFTDKCKGIRNEWREAFKLRMPVHAKKQLEENVRLRSVCHNLTDSVLDAQSQNRTLKNLQKALDLEEEIQSFAESSSKYFREKQENRLEHLLQVHQQLKLKIPDTTQESLSKKVQNGEEFLEQSEAVDQLNQDQKLYLKRFEEKIWSIEVHEVEGSKLQDRLQELNSILKDQTDYRRSLECQMEDNIDKNGVMMSAILRAGKIFQTRCDKTQTENDEVLDFDLLHQIRMLLEQSLEC